LYYDEVLSIKCLGESLSSKAKEAMFFVFRELSPINAITTESEIIKWKASPAAKSTKSK